MPRDILADLHQRYDGPIRPDEVRRALGCAPTHPAMGFISDYERLIRDADAGIAKHGAARVPNLVEARSWYQERLGEHRAEVAVWAAGLTDDERDLLAQSSEVV